jgi:putative tricarboxylic transport membrane protein
VKDALLRLLSLAALLPSGRAAAEPWFDRLSLLAPGSGGGGWDQTARAMEDVLEGAGLVGDVVVVNSPGAGGAIGLAQFVNGQRGDSAALLVGGLVMISAIRTAHATVSLGQTTPIARLAGDYQVIAVPARSDLRDLADLVQALRVNPGAVTWGGGSAGGPDQLLLHELADAIGVEPSRTNYVAFSGGGEVAEALLGNQVTAGVSGFSELAAQVDAGRLRALAISSAERLPGSSTPTLRELGVAVTLMNWRALFAPPGLDAAQRGRLVDLVARMVALPEWKAALRAHRWTNLHLAGPAFEEFLRAEEARVAAAPDPRARAAGRPPGVWTGGMWLLKNRLPLAVGVSVLALLAACFIAWQRTSGVRRERELHGRLEEAEAKYRERSAETQVLLRGISEQIERQFQTWALTVAEREIAMLMLKGLRHKEIASLRGTSERTVRQQALTIYKKAGLDGRTDLAAFFLEDFLQPVETQGGRRSA